MACKARDCSQSLVESSHAFACFESSGSTASLLYYNLTERICMPGAFWPGDVFGRGGRACAMQIYAGGAARNKVDMMAFEMTVATHGHNSTAVQSLNAAGASVVARFLRANSGCN